MTLKGEYIDEFIKLNLTVSYAIFVILIGSIFW